MTQTKILNSQRGAYLSLVVYIVLSVAKYIADMCTIRQL